MTRVLASLVWMLSLTSVAACGYPRAGAAPGPVTAAWLESARTHWPDASETTLEEGRQAFLTHCNQCHSYPDRAAITADRWPSIMRRMGVKSYLSSAQTEAVLRFILVSR